MINEVTLFVCGVKLKMQVTDLKDAIEKLQFFQQIPEFCPVCSTAVKFRHYITKPPGNHKYYGLECTGEPKHQINFHQYKEDGAFYLKDKEPWKAYESGATPDEGGGDATPTSQTTDAQRRDIGAKLAANIKEEGEKSDRIWRVGAFVVRLGTHEEKAVPLCDCKVFIETWANDKTYVCEHIYGVKAFIDQRKAAT